MMKKLLLFCCASRPRAAPANLEGRQGAGRRRCEGRPENDVVQHPLLNPAPTAATTAGARRAACLEMIRAESPDVIGFQEPHRPQIDYLKVNLPQNTPRSTWGATPRPTSRRNPTAASIDDHVPPFEIHSARQRVFLDQPLARKCPSRGWDAMCRCVTVWVQLKTGKTGKGSSISTPISIISASRPAPNQPDDSRPDEADRR